MARTYKSFCKLCRREGVSLHIKGALSFNAKCAVKRREYPPGQHVYRRQKVSDYGLKLPAANGKLAVSGFCWGGGQTFRFATNRKDLKAAFVFYGTSPAHKDEYARIAAPVFGFYGGNDERVNATLPATEKMMQAAGKKFDPVIYAGAGHGFMRAGEQSDDPNDPNRKARDEAWQRWRQILTGIGAN